MSIVYAGYGAVVPPSLMVFFFDLITLKQIKSNLKTKRKKNMSLDAETDETDMTGAGISRAFYADRLHGWVR